MRLPQSVAAPARTPFLLTAPGVLLLIAAFMGLHFAIRFVVSPTLGFDDSEQALLGQHLALGYRFRQPPLYSWLIWASEQAFGYTLFAVTLVNYGLQALCYLFLYLAARRALGDELRAALALFSFALIYVFAYYALHDLTHTVAVAALIAANLYFLIGLVQRGGWPDALLFGLTLGLGALSKYNFLIYVAALLLAAALLPQLRRRVYGARGLIALALAVAINLPYLLWWMTGDHSLFDLTAKVVSADAAGGAGDWFARRWQGLVSLLLAIVDFPLPFVVVFAILFPEAILRRTAAPDPDGLRRYFALHMVFGLGLMLLAVLVFGASSFKSRWFHPILMLLPLYLFARLDPAALPWRRVQLFIAVAGLATLVAMGGRFLEDYLRERNCRICRAHWPIAEIGEELAAAGFRRGTILVMHHHAGGNLLGVFPDSRILEPSFPITAFPPDPVADQCLLLWDEDQSTLPKHMANYLANYLNAGVGERPRDGVISAPFGPDDERRYGLSYALIEGGVADCR